MLRAVHSRAMDSAPSPTAVLDTLRTVEFRLGLKGYNVDEVDEYLEKAAVEAEALKEQMRQQSERLQQASQRAAQLEKDGGTVTEAPREPLEVPSTVADDTLQRTLMLAQRFVEQTKRESEEEAHQVIGRAEEQARAIIAQAEERARQMSAESEHRLREEVARLESLRSNLSGDVENLARHLESERTRLRGSFTDMVKWLDEKVQPSAALMGLRQRSAGPGGFDRSRASGLAGESSNGEARASSDVANDGARNEPLERRPGGSEGLG